MVYTLINPVIYISINIYNGHTVVIEGKSQICPQGL